MIRNLDLSPVSALRERLAIIGLGLLVFIGMAAGYWLRGMLEPAAAVAEVVAPAPAVLQVDGSVIAERAPAAKPPPVPHRLPQGFVEERRVSAEIKPAHAGNVGIDLSLVRDTAGGRRAIVSSPDGEVVTALDVPILPGLVPAPPRRWAAGVAINPFDPDDGRGAWVTRDYGRVRAGTIAFQHRGELGALVLLGVSF